MQFQFKDTLNDLRTLLIRQTVLLVGGFSLALSYWVLAAPQFQVALFTALVGFVVGLGMLYQQTRTNLQLARYSIVVWLNLALPVAMLLTDATWIPFLGLPIILMGSMLVSHSGFLTGILILISAFWLTTLGDRTYPLEPITALTILTTLATWRMVETFFTALMWYSSMQHRADKLLQETREQRADLAAAVKSLNNAQDSQRRLQRELIRAHKKAEEARQLKERFAANISHEIRTPLNLIMGFSEVMHVSPEVYSDGSFSPKLRRDIFQIYRSSRYLLDMIDDILALSQVEMSQFSIHLDDVDLKQFLGDTLDIAEGLFRGSTLTLETNFAPSLPPIAIDRTRIRQALINLLSNARRFTDQGTITLSVWVEEPQVYFEVQDTGTGIPDDKLKYIFDEFYQVDYSLSRSHGGAGLGLAITKRFVEAHGGSIWVNSSEHHGSTFTFTLPLTQLHQTRGGNRRDGRKTQPLTPIKQTILTLDADDQAEGMIRQFLTDYEIIRVEDTQQLASTIEQYRPHAIIQNVAHTPAIPDIPSLEIPVIQCTLPSNRWLLERFNVLDYLTKPITIDKLSALLDTMPHLQRVLIVDNDRGFIQFIERILEVTAPHIQTTHAYDGEQGLAILEDTPTPPDLIFLDLMMPNVDGFAFLDTMHTQFPRLEVPVILVTATTQLDDTLAQHIVVQHPKGFQPAEILNCLKLLIPQLKTDYSTYTTPRS